MTTPLSIYIGLLHLKRTIAFATEASVAVESNPFVYKIQPGKEQEVFLPLMIVTARGLARVMERQEILRFDEKEPFNEIMSKADQLLAGHVVGRPRRPDLLKQSQRNKTN